MEKIVTKGIVLRATATKEADYILNILTDTLGRIAVVARGARRIVLGLGGSATNDGGCGCAAALGVRFTDAGGGVVFVSSELTEMIENCDRILLIKYNRIVGELRDVPRLGLTEDSLMAAIQ